MFPSIKKFVADESIRDPDADEQKVVFQTDLEEPLPKLRAEDDSTLVLFLVDRSAQASTAGTISGQ